MTGGVGAKLRELRKARGITQRALAAEVGIHFSSLSNIENDKEPCGEGTIRRLAEALGADEDLLLGEAGHRAMPFRVLGNIAAGTPIEAMEHVDTFDLSQQFDPQDHYMLTVRGDSMILDGINDGDLAVIRHSTSARNGQTVVAIVGDEEATLKRYSCRGKQVTLTPANDTLKPRTYPQKSVQIRGVLVGIVRTEVR
jgi:SOS regulatory protein LexA